MKIQIDTDEKIIRIDENVNINDLVSFLKDSIKDWKQYTIETNTIWNNPIYVEKYPSWPYNPVNPWGPVWCSKTSPNEEQFINGDSVTLQNDLEWNNVTQKEDNLKSLTDASWPKQNPCNPFVGLKDEFKSGTYNFEIAN